MSLKNQIALSSLQGKGIEFGALNNPLPVDQSKATVDYADRLPKIDALRLFPELESIADSIIDPSLIVDLDTDDLSVIGSGGYDFVVANHVIEHVANPIRFLKNVSDHLKPKGRFFLTVPDRDFTFDKNRSLTSNEYLLEKFRSNETKVRNTDIKDFLLYKEAVDTIHPAVEKYFKENGLPLSYYDENKLPLNPFKRKRLYDFHRSRSIHVHVWNRASFDEFLDFAMKQVPLMFSVIETHNPNEVQGEMIYLLERTPA